MTYPLKSLEYTNEPFAYTNSNYFSNEEIEKIVELGNKNFKGTAEINKGINDQSVRSSVISWITPTDESLFIFKKLSDAVNQINDRFFKYDIHTLEDLQFTEYDSSYKGKYSAHSDDGYDANLFRKLSVSVQLSDEHDYEGGELVFYRHSLHSPSIAPKSKGSVIIFPSYVVHEVTPVTRGLRKSLVSWISGPRFK